MSSCNDVFSTVSRPPGSGRNRLGDPGLPGLTEATSNPGRDAGVCGQARDGLKIAMQTTRIAALMRNVAQQIIYEDNTTTSFVCQEIYDAAGGTSSRTRFASKARSVLAWFLDVIDDQHFHRTLG
jgi:hypothetical protein